MDFKEASEQAKKVAEKYKTAIDNEVAEQFVSEKVAEFVRAGLNKVINQSADHLRKNKLSSHAQFLRALEIVMRNQAMSVKEQMEIFNEVPEDPA